MWSSAFILLFLLPMASLCSGLLWSGVFGPG